MALSQLNIHCAWLWQWQKMFLSINSITAQSIAKVDNHPSKEMDLVLFTFGIEQPVPIGTISNSGEINFNFPKDLNFISDEAKANSFSDAAFTLFSKCNNSYTYFQKKKIVKQQLLVIFH